jgi:transcriptional regulator with XRE-family HTH domain
MKYIGKNIRRLRQKKGWSQSQVAAQLNISVPAFSKIETGITDINISRLTQIAALFGITAAAILQEDENFVPSANAGELARLKEKLQEREEELSSLQRRLINIYEELRRG